MERSFEECRLKTMSRARISKLGKVHTYQRLIYSKSNESHMGSRISNYYFLTIRNKYNTVRLYLS